MPEASPAADGLQQADAVPARHSFLIAIGSLGLLIAMAADAVAVLGRHAGFTLPGSIEVFQVAIVVALSLAILLASLFDRHASVDLLIGRAGPRARRILFLIGQLTLALTFAALCAGSIWVSWDLWATHEMTEILAIPLRPFRLVWIACSGVIAALFAMRFVRALRS